MRSLTTDFKLRRTALIKDGGGGIPILFRMAVKNRKKRGRGRSELSFEVEDLFLVGGEGSGGGEKIDEVAEGAEAVGKAVISDERGAGEKVARASKKLRMTAKADPAPGRWRAPRGFQIFGEDDESRRECLRIHRKSPSPEIFEETLFRLMAALPGRGGRKVFCGGGVFPAVAASAAGEINKLVVDGGGDAKATEAIFHLVPDAEVGKLSDDKYDIVLLCHDHLTGDRAAEAVVEACGSVAGGGILVVCFPAEALLDYATNIRMEAPNMRNRVHRLCRTHFVLRATGPLMQPSWDIMVMGKRGGQVDIPICKWRFTGSGVLPWQKCNEAFSSAPWLLVETIDQTGPAIARCINYPWEPFHSGGGD